MMKKYVGYFRVSSQKQGKSGLGLESQRTMVNNFLKTNQGQMVDSFTEVETGTSKKQRIEIFNAIKFAKQNGAVLLIAKLDRLARNVHFVSSLMEAGVEFVCCDMPSANNLTVFILSAIAEEEAKTISSRTRLALAEKKKQGFKLGTPENLSYQHRLKGGEAMRKKSLENNTNIQTTALIVEYRARGMSYDKIATQLTTLNFSTVNGKEFTSTGVMRLYKRAWDNQSVNQAA
jgi:DNA invertase Pin-like site-specific DNA recombinase